MKSRSLATHCRQAISPKNSLIPHELAHRDQVSSSGLYHWRSARCTARTFSLSKNPLPCCFALYVSIIGMTCSPWRGSCDRSNVSFLMRVLSSASMALIHSSRIADGRWRTAHKLDSSGRNRSISWSELVVATHNIAQSGCWLIAAVV